MQTLSDMASVLLPGELPCDDCDTTGQQGCLQTNVQSFFSPYEYVKQTCSTCFGRGVREADVCPLCGEEEGGCGRLCKPAPCCQKHPVDCACPNGIEMYLETYGLPKAA